MEAPPYRVEEEGDEDHKVAHDEEEPRREGQGEHGAWVAKLTRS
jgi:hypothetical protein